MGDPPPLCHQEGLDNMKYWLQSINRVSLWDIWVWELDDESTWKDWDLGNYPERLKDEAHLLINSLQGKASLKSYAKDKRG